MQWLSKAALVVNLYTVSSLASFFSIKTHKFKSNWEASQENGQQICMFIDMKSGDSKEGKKKIPSPSKFQ